MTELTASAHAHFWWRNFDAPPTDHTVTGYSYQGRVMQPHSVELDVYSHGDGQLNWEITVHGNLYRTKDGSVGQQAAKDKFWLPAILRAVAEPPAWVSELVEPFVDRVRGFDLLGGAS